MTLAQAQSYAEKIVAWLAPYCHRIEIAGSIRRCRPICNDVDLVVIPKFEPRPVDMFQNAPCNLLREALIQYVAASEGSAGWLRRANSPDVFGPEPGPDAINLLIQLPKCQLDIFCATAETWATLFLCRTGSREHNIWFASRAKELGGHWNPYKGLELAGQNICASTEEDLYQAIQAPYLPPQERERMPVGHIP